MYKFKKAKKSTIRSVEVLEGETLEEKIRRIIHNGEPITDGSPEIFTERKDGVLPETNIRTDRWEIAADAMDKIAGSIEARRDNKPNIGHDDKTAKLADGSDNKSSKPGGDESTQGKAVSNVTATNE